MQNLQKRTMEMSSGGPKMVERSYGVAGNGRNITNFPVVHGGSRRRFAGPISVRPAAVRREIPPAGSSGCCAPSRPVCRRWPAGGVSSGPISHGSQMNKRPNSVPGLESSFLGFLELKKCLGGWGFIWNPKLCLYRV